MASSTTINASGTLLFQQVDPTPLEYSSDNGDNWTPITSWPVLLNNTDAINTTLTVKFTTDLSLNSNDQYLIMDSDNITIDGSDNVVNVDIDYYPGLIQNGTSSDAKSDITIKNLGVISALNVLTSGGWIGQQYFGVGGTNNSAINCYSTGIIQQNAGGIFGADTEASATNCYSTGTIVSNAGGIFGANCLGTATNCYSNGAIGDYAGGIFGLFTKVNSSAINCYSTGTILQNAGGIFGSSSYGSATNCYSTGAITGLTAGGIFGESGLGRATNCYSTGVIGESAGGIFGQSSSGSASNCYSIGDINGNGAGGIFGQASLQDSSATNCYSIGSISGNYAGGIFGLNSLGTATNCYSTGTITNNSEGIGGYGTQNNCYYTDGSANWLDSAADASLNIASNVWTDINLNSETIPYLLSAFTSTLYSTISATDASNSGASVVTDCSFSIVSVNGLNPSLYSSDITIDSNTGDITFDLLSLQNGAYEVNVLATNTTNTTNNTNYGYSFGTFTNNVTTIDASGTVLLQQNGANVEYSLDASATWTTAVWPLTLQNADTSSTLEVRFVSNLTFDSSAQYFIIDSSNITIDGSDNVVNINLIDAGYPGLVRNGTYSYNGSGNITANNDAYSDITIQNITLNSNSSSLLAIAPSTNTGSGDDKYGNGWLCQAYFGLGGSNNNVDNCSSNGTTVTSYWINSNGIQNSDSFNSSGGCILGDYCSADVTNCYSSGDISNSAGGIFGLNSAGSATNCYSTGDIGANAGGIFGAGSQGSANNCYSIGTTIYSYAGGIFGTFSSGSATNCYSSGTIGSYAGGIFGDYSQGSATNCYSIGTIGDSAGGIFGSGSLSSARASNCYSTGTIGNGAGGIFGFGGAGSATNCYYTNGPSFWSDSAADASLNIASNAWTDIDLSANNVPYLLSSFTSTLYSTSSGTDATTSGASVVTDCSFSIVSVNSLNPSLYSSDITIDANTGDITFDLLSLQNGAYEVNVLATNTTNNTNYGYSFGTFTNNVTTIDASGSVLIQQNGANVQYSLDASATWTTALWPVTLNNTDTSSPLEVRFVSDLSFNSADQYFIIDSSNITIDGSDNTVNINLIDAGYPGLVRNGTYYYNQASYITANNDAYSDITIQNITLNSNSSSLLAIAGTIIDQQANPKIGNGWLCQAYFGLGGSNNNVNNCSTNGGTVTSGYTYTIYWIDSSGDQYNTNTTTTAGGCILGDSCSVDATNCYSTGTIGDYAGGIFGDGSQAGASATNCYSIGPIGDAAGGIFGASSSGSAANCYSNGPIGSQAGGIFGQFSSSQAQAINCYSTSEILGNYAGGIFGYNSQGRATNCYSIGNYSSSSGGEGIGGNNPINCYATDGSANWLDASANEALDFSGNPWTDIDTTSTKVPYLLSSFYTPQTLYDPSSGTDVVTETPDISGNYTWSITSVNGSTSGNAEIAIDASTGIITFGSLQNGVYEVNVVAVDSFGIYSFETFTNNITTIDASGSVLVKQDVGSDVQYSLDASATWTTAVWPVTLQNADTTNTLTVTFTTDLSLNSAYQYFIIDSSNITIDGSDNVVNVYIDNYPGLIQNGTVSNDANSYITIRNLGVKSTNTLADRGGWIGQQYFGNGATNNNAINCYSTGNINFESGGIFGFLSQGSATNCYSTGTIGDTAGGIFGKFGSGSIRNCYSIGTIANGAGGIFGSISQGTATNCYSTGSISPFDGAGIFGQASQGSATNCYSTGTGATNINKGIGASINISYCYYTDGSSNWLDASANDALDFSGNPWTDIDVNSDTVPYLLTSFLNQQILYDPSAVTDKFVITTELSNPTAYTWSITSVDGDANGNPDITIDASGTLRFDTALQADTYIVNILATDKTGGTYSFETFTNDLTTTVIDASGEVSFREQNGVIQYSEDGNNWTPVTTWPVTLNNVDSIAPGARAGGAPLIITYTSDLSFNSATQYFVLGTDDIIIDGSNHVVYVNVSIDDYPGLYQNGTLDTIGNSNITIRNLGVESTYNLTNGGGWIGQAYFGNDASENYVENCYSTGTIGSQAGGIFGQNSSGSISNCYSRGPIAFQAGGIFGQRSTSQAIATNCYSTGPISNSAGGIFGYSSSGSATNCYSTGTTIGSNAGGIFGQDCSGSATNCYSIGTIGSDASGIFGFGSQGTATNCYSTNNVTNWLDASANDALDVSGNYTDIDEKSTKVPYRLTSFLNQQPLYDPDSSNNAVTEYPDIANPIEYTWSITSVNGSTTNNEGITINSSTGEIEFNVTSNDTYLVNVLATDQFGNYAYETFTNIISNICFPAGTPIVTNQGIIAINKINPKIHTIRNKKIVAITKTVTPNKYLVRFEKDALGTNLPCEATTMTKNHMLFYKGKMMKAKEFLKTHNDSVSKVTYNGQVLYNVLLEEHDKMVVNNLICETLHPDNYVAQMYRAFKTLTPKQRIEAIQKVNKVVLTEGIYKKHTSKK